MLCKLDSHLTSCNDYVSMQSCTCMNNSAGLWGDWFWQQKWSRRTSFSRFSAKIGQAWPILVWQTMDNGAWPILVWQTMDRSTSTRFMGPVFGTTKVTTIRNRDLLFWSRFIRCRRHAAFHPSKFHHVFGILHHIIRLLAHAINVNTNFD